MAVATPRKKGVCKRFDCAKGFGFIIPFAQFMDGPGSVFVHFSDIKAQGFKGLAQGEMVEFDIAIQDDGRRKAVNVTGPNGTFVIGPKRRNMNGGAVRNRKRGRSDSAEENGSDATRGGDQSCAPPAKRQKVSSCSNSSPCNQGLSREHSTPDPSPQSPVGVARTECPFDLYLFKKNGPDDGAVPMVVQLATSGDLRRMIRYIANGGDLDERQHWKEIQDHYGFYEKEWEWWNASALMRAANKGDVEMVRLLLWNQADPMLESCYIEDETCTASDFAAKGKNQEIIQMISVANDLWKALNPKCKESARYDHKREKKNKPEREQIKKAIDSLCPNGNTTSNTVNEIS